MSSAFSSSSDKIIAKLYEDNALGKVSDERYQSMSSGYESEQSALKASCKELLAEVGKADEVYANAENFTSLIRQYTDVTELNAKILNELIDRIIVHEKTTNEDGSKSQRVDIYYKFIGYLSMEGWCQAVKLEDVAENQVQKTA